MRRITTWLTATLAVVAMATYYQASLSGDGKHSERTGTGAPAAADCGGPRQSQASGTTPLSEADDAQPSGGDKADDPCANSDHSGKPGESR